MDERIIWFNGQRESRLNLKCFPGARLTPGTGIFNVWQSVPVGFFTSSSFLFFPKMIAFECICMANKILNGNMHQTTKTHTHTHQVLHESK